MGFLSKTQSINTSLFCALFLFSAIFSPIPASFGQIDLHAHVDMKSGVGPLLRGDFAHAIKSHDWESRLSTKANSQSLLAWKGPGILVVSLYAHPILAFFESPEADLLHLDDAENVRQGLEQEYIHVFNFVNAHRNRFKIVRNAREGEKAVKEGKVAVLLSIEGAYAALETEADFKKWIDQRGVSIVTPFHLTEDHFGGTALLQTSLGWANSFPDFMSSLWSSHFNCLRTFCKSTIGIKPDGRILLDRLMARKVWIDVSHSNDLQVHQLLTEFGTKKLPLLITHTQPRNWYEAERGMSEEEVDYLKREGGIIGLIPTQDWMIHQGKIESGVQSFKRLVLEMTQLLGSEKVSLGSDVNAPLKGLSPDRTNSQLRGSVEIDGYYSYDQWSELSAFASPTPDWTQKNIEHFLKEWQRVRP